MSIDTPDVPGTIDQVDVNITVTERPTGNILFGIGYAGEDGLILQAEVNRENLLDLAATLNSNSITRK